MLAFPFEPVLLGKFLLLYMHGGSMQERVLFPGPELEPGKKISPKQQMNEFERRQERALTLI